MTDLLTTRQLQEILKVDRTTIYRMIEQKRLPAVKIGNQWRFPRQAIEELLASPLVTSAQQANTARDQGTHPASILPLECVQLIQDAFAEALGVMAIVTDMQGTPVTYVSNPCGLCSALQKAPSVRQACSQSWLRIATNPCIEAQFAPCHLGLLCTRGLVRFGNQLQAIAVLGGVAPQTWPPSEEEIETLAEELTVDATEVKAHIQEVFRLDAEEQHAALTFVQRIADIIAHVGNERSSLLNRLRNIAELSSL
jgi:excisionase family DNA binding protein